MGKVTYFFRIIIFTLFISSFSIGADFELDKIIADANKTDRQVMLFLHKDGCGFCEKMVFDLEDENISKTIDKNFIFVDINRDDDETISFKKYEGSNKNFLKKLDVHFYPTVLFIDKNSTFVYNVIGYHNKKNLLTTLKYIASNSYKDETYDEFKDKLLGNENDE